MNVRKGKTNSQTQSNDCHQNTQITFYFREISNSARNRSRQQISLASRGHGQDTCKSPARRWQVARIIRSNREMARWNRLTEVQKTAHSIGGLYKTIALLNDQSSFSFPTFSNHQQLDIVNCLSKDHLRFSKNSLSLIII